MLSVTIICAAHVLLELDKVKDCGQQQGGGLFSPEFGIFDDLRRHTLRRVLRTLLRVGYIQTTPNKRYTILKDVEQITLMDLIRIFHGDVCVGEVFDHYKSIGMENLKTPEYRNLLKLEIEISKELVQRFEAIRLRDFRDELPVHRIVKVPQYLAAVVNE